MFKKMENTGYQRDVERGVELKEKYPLSNKPTNGMPQQDPVQPSTSCKPEVCQAARMRFATPELAQGGPWHRNKTIYLITFLVALGVWLIIYVTLSQMKIL